MSVTTNQRCVTSQKNEDHKIHELIRNQDTSASVVQDVAEAPHSSAMDTTDGWNCELKTLHLLQKLVSVTGTTEISW
jgi:hypothetical protein